MGEARIKEHARQAVALTRRTLDMAWNHDCLGQAKAAAYSTILFFFPLLLFLVALLIATNWFTVVAQPVVDFLPRFLPDTTRALVSEYVVSTASKNPTHLLVASFLIMLWTGWGLMSTFIEGVNRAHGVIEERTLLKDQIAALQLLLLAALPLLGLALVAIFRPLVEAWVVARLGLHLSFLWRLLNWSVIVLTMMAVNWVVYYVGVHRRQTWRDPIPGAALATAIWLASGYAFQQYVLHFGRYDLIYGSLGAAIVLLGWMYLSALAVLLGAEFNAALEQTRRERRPSGEPAAIHNRSR